MVLRAEIDREAREVPVVVLDRALGRRAGRLRQRGDLERVRGDRLLVAVPVVHAECRVHRDRRRRLEGEPMRRLELPREHVVVLE